MNDIVTHPDHYTTGKIEVIDFIVDQKLGYRLGNAVKYICRCRHKGNVLLDLLKARQYIDFMIEEVTRIEAEQNTQEDNVSEQAYKNFLAGGRGYRHDWECGVCGDVCKCREEEDRPRGQGMDTT